MLKMTSVCVLFCYFHVLMLYAPVNKFDLMHVDGISMTLSILYFKGSQIGTSKL